MNEPIQQVLYAQEIPSPDLLYRIREQGQENLPLLIQSLQQRDEKRLEFIILLLGSLNAQQSIPALLDILRDRELASNIHTAIVTALHDMQAVDELLEVIQDEQVSVIGRCGCVEAATSLTVGSQEIHARVCQTLRDVLTGILNRAPGITDEEILIGEELITALTALADREADDLLEEAFFSSGIEVWFILHDELLQTPRRIEKRLDWLEQYKVDYQKI